MIVDCPFADGSWGPNRFHFAAVIIFPLFASCSYSLKCLNEKYDHKGGDCLVGGMARASKLKFVVKIIVLLYRL
jgi:hypothetical protein